MDENLRVVRAVYAAWNSSDVEGFLQYAADEIEADWSRALGPYRGVYRGKAEVGAAWRTFISAFDDVRWEVQELHELDAETVLSVSGLSARGLGSGAEVQTTPAALVWTLRDGKVVRTEIFQSKADALEGPGHVS